MQRRLHAVTLALLTASMIYGAELPHSAVYAATTATQSYSTFIGPIPIAGLSVTLPAATQLANTAIVTLSMPNLYLSAPTSPTAPMSADIQIVAPFAPGGLVSATGGIGCDTTTVNTSGKKPITIVLRVSLGSTTQMVEAEWSSQNGTVTTDQFASISAILVRD